MASERDRDGSASAPRWIRFSSEYPEVASSYSALRDACGAAGPLDARTSALIKLAVSIGLGAERTVHRHAKKALHAGADPAEVKHVAVLALPTVGLPAALDAISWVEESIREMDGGRV